MTQTDQGETIELLYRSLKRTGGLAAAVADREITADRIRDAFETTAASLVELKARGAFRVAGNTKALFDLFREYPQLSKGPPATKHLQGLLFSSPMRSVEGHDDLDFMFVAHELTPGSAAGKGKSGRSAVIGDALSADVFMMNTRDRTPIVAEYKLRTDRDPEYALVQALAVAAQLTPPSQRRRVKTEFRDHFGESFPERLDIYVMVADAPATKSWRTLFERATRHAAELTANQSAGADAFRRHVRRIVFLEVVVEGGELKFQLLERFETALPIG